MTIVTRIHAFGGPEVLSLDEVPTPEPIPGEMLVRIDAASVNPVDYKIRQGLYPGVSKDDLPVAMGRDIAGIVERTGETEDSFERGAVIFAMLGPGRGGYARHVIVRPSEAAAVPPALSAVEAAAVPLAGLTAWQGLFDHGELVGGQTVLIHGGAGGVGHFAVQFAKAQGARVITTARAEDAEFLTDLGADRVIDYRDEDFTETCRDIDLVFDLVGGETQERSWSVLRRGGAMVSTLGPPPQERARELGARALGFLTQPSGTQLEEIGYLIAKGQVRVEVSARFPLSEAGAAQEKLEHDHIRGKIVLIPG